MKVIIQDGKFEKGLKLFKKKVDDLGILKDLREKDCYLKPSVKKKLARSAAKKRWIKFVNSNNYLIGNTNGHYRILEMVKK